ncbi:MAG TPA: S41 family peptidase [Anaerolineae bacterium]|nr:S41 family peptidase [Anaerolineae bacterium]
MSSKISRVIVGVVVGVLLSMILFSSGWVMSSYLAHWGIMLPGFTLPTTDGDYPDYGPNEAPTGELENLFTPFWEAWDIVHEDFVHQPIDDLEIMRGAIRGMLEALDDPHSSYMDPDQYRQSNIPLEGEYEGIGAWVDPTGEFLIIIAPMPGSPAEQAGLQPGDQVIAIDGEDMTGIDGNLVIRRILGPAGSIVRLTILREGEFEPFDVDIERASITIPSVESQMLEDGIGYIQLFNFGENAANDLRQTLRTLLDQDPIGLILDLRGNGGGFLGTAIDITSEFISEGTVVIERFGDGSEMVHSVSGAGLATDIPLIVLIDGGSASASEIVAGAIQDHERGLLVGETSFGKGSVQTWTPLSGDNGAVRVTIALWFTPDGRLIHQTGLEPDVEVLLTEDDILNDLDPQLDEAIQLLLEGLD